MKSVIVGTAGHIDHGKTSLVKALTGIDADRLDEEKRRGITIDIGFAHLELPTPGGDTLRLGFVDVPGHERFVRNMLAGVGGIDLVLLVIAADEGIKPQTREHFDICRLLAVRRGITVLTKSDAVDADTLEVVRLEVEDFLRGSFLDPAHSPIVAVSSLTGAGLIELKSALAKVTAEVPAKDPTAVARLPIDRVFTMKGFGTVVTGTLVAGTITKEDELEIFPTGKRVRVRGVQVHGAAADQAIAGQRTALNLAGVATEDLARGMVLAPLSTFTATRTVDVQLSTLPSAPGPMKHRARVHFHSHTMETVAEVVLPGVRVASPFPTVSASSGRTRTSEPRQLHPGEESFARLKLSEDTLLLPGDRFIIRRFSPVMTIGGGVVLDASPTTRNLSVDQALETLAGQDRVAILRARIWRNFHDGISLQELVAETGWTKAVIESLLAEAVNRGHVVRIDSIVLHAPAWEKLKAEIVPTLTEFHRTNPLVGGMNKEQLRDQSDASGVVFDEIMKQLSQEKQIEVTGEVVRLRGRSVVMQDEEAESKKIIEQAFASAGLKVPSLKEVLAGLKVDKARAQKIVTLLLRDKVLIKISDDLVFHQSALVGLRQKIAALKTTTPKIDVACFKDLTGVSRKYAIPLLEYLDRERVTKRVGNERIIL